jgi:primase-polymerase (primpol)-like protein
VGENDPFTFVDLDGVRDPETGVIEAWAQGIIERLDSYTEASSSGSRGVHVLVEAHKPGPRTQTNALPNFEMYSRSRPALITGARLNDKDIEPRQKSLSPTFCG